jgi:hypothetical protein
MEEINHIRRNRIEEIDGEIQILELDSWHKIDMLRALVKEREELNQKILYNKWV